MGLAAFPERLSTCCGNLGANYANYHSVSNFKSEEGDGYVHFSWWVANTCVWRIWIVGGIQVPLDYIGVLFWCPDQRLTPLRERNKFWRNFCMGQPHHTIDGYSRIFKWTSLHRKNHRVGLVFRAISLAYWWAIVGIRQLCQDGSELRQLHWDLQLDLQLECCILIGAGSRPPAPHLPRSKMPFRESPMEEVAGERTVCLKSFKIYVSICFNLSVFCIFRLLGFDTLWFHTAFPMSWGPEASEFGSDRRDWKRQDHSGELSCGGPPEGRWE